MSKNPQAVLDVLEFYTENMVSGRNRDEPSRMIGSPGLGSSLVDELEPPKIPQRNEIESKMADMSLSSDRIGGSSRDRPPPNIPPPIRTRPDESDARAVSFADSGIGHCLTFNYSNANVRENGKEKGRRKEKEKGREQKTKKGLYLQHQRLKVSLLFNMNLFDSLKSN